MKRARSFGRGDRSREAGRSRWFRRLRFAVVVIAAGSLAGCSASPVPTQSPTVAIEPSLTPTISQTPAASPTPAASLVEARSMEEAGATRLPVSADWLTLAGGSVWAAAGIGIERLDSRDGSVLGSIAVPRGVCLAFDVGFDSLWAGGGEGGSPALRRIDPNTGDVAATIPLKPAVADIQCESSVGAGDGAVWLLSFPPNRVLWKIDPATNAVTAAFPMPPEDPQGTNPYATDFGGVRAGFGGVWIADQGHDSLLRMSPTDGSIVAHVSLGSGSGPRFVALGAGSVWVLNQVNGTVSRVDPSTNSVVATIRVSSIPVDGGDIAFGCGAVWARVSDELVARIDPATNGVIARFGPAAGSGSVACGDNVLWISAHDVDAIWRVPLP